MHDVLCLIVEKLEKKFLQLKTRTRKILFCILRNMPLLPINNSRMSTLRKASKIDFVMLFETPTHEFLKQIMHSS